MSRPVKKATKQPFAGIVKSQLVTVAPGNIRRVINIKDLAKLNCFSNKLRELAKKVKVRQITPAPMGQYKICDPSKAEVELTALLWDNRETINALQFLNAPPEWSKDKKKILNDFHMACKTAMRLQKSGRPQGPDQKTKLRDETVRGEAQKMRKQWPYDSKRSIAESVKKKFRLVITSKSLAEKSLIPPRKSR